MTPCPGGRCPGVSLGTEGLSCPPVTRDQLPEPCSQPSQLAHLTVVVVPVPPHQVDTVTVLVPESPLVGQSTVGDG